VQPVLLRLGDVAIPSYGALYFTAYVMAGILAGLEARRLRQSPFAVLGGIVVGVGVALFCGRVAWYLIHEAGRGGGFSLRGGTTFTGALLGFVLAVGLYGFAMRAWRPKSLTIPGYLDIYGLVGSLGHGIGRVGCFLAGCCYGAPTESLLGVTYTAQGIMAPRGTPVHPTQLYEAIGEFALFGVLWWRRKRKRFTGELILLYLAGYGALRFVVEFFRGDPRPEWLGLSVIQWWCVALGSLAALLLASLLVYHRAREGSR